MIVDFSKIEIEGLEGKELLDIRKQLGNYLYYQSQDLSGSELGRNIYFSNGEIEIKEEEKKIIKDAVNVMYKSYVIKTAINKLFN